jgi:hypothetical protein
MSHRNEVFQAIPFEASSDTNEPLIAAGNAEEEDRRLQEKVVSRFKYSTNKTKPAPTMFPTTQSISKETKGPSTGIDTTTNRAFMVVLGLVIYSLVSNISGLLAYGPESQSATNATGSVAANASTALVAQKKDWFRKGYSSSSNSANPTGTGTPLQLKELQLDIMVPVFQRDDRLRVFAADLGKAIVDYKQNANNDGTPQISAFRVLVTRYSSDETSQPNSTADFQSELAALAFLPKNDIVMVHAPSGQAFSRSAARNLLHDNACPLDTCLATGMDVDMEIRQEFFQHAVQMVVLMQDEENVSQPFKKLSKQQINRQILLHKNTSVPTVYFPIVWNAYNPQSIQLVETFLRQQKRQPNFTLDEFSEHRGKWFPHGLGMYVMRGSDTRLFRFDTTFQGWGGEDVHFFFMIWQHRRLLRRHETGLIHVWHDKSCVMGKGVFTKKEMKDCGLVRNQLQGSKLGIKLERKSKKKKRGIG